MAEETKVSAVKAPQQADPMEASIEVSTQEMIRRAQKLQIETVFDRAVTMKPCAIGMQGICCKNCAMGPCRLPLPKGGVQGDDTRKGLCGATPNTIAARNWIRMIAGGAAAHSDHGRGVALTFLSVARKETKDYTIKDPAKLISIAPYFGVATTVEVDGKKLDRDIDEIALGVAEAAVAEWGKTDGFLSYLKRAPQPLQDKWEKQGVKPRNIDREIVEIMHRTHMGVDQDYKNLLKQGARASIADGWGGSMIGTDLQDVMFGTPAPLQAEANLGVMKADHVNIIVHGHEPLLSEMIVAAAQSQEMIDLAKQNGAKGIQLSGICCTANELLQRHGIPPAGTFLQQELAIITGACDAMVVDVQCIFQNLANVAKCFHTKLITTHPIARMEQENVIHIEFDEHYAMQDAMRIVKMAVENFQNRGAEVMIPQHKTTQIAGFGVESIQYHLGGSFRGSYYTLNDNIINGRIRGIAGVVGCNNARTKHNEEHITIIKELIKNDVIVLTTGCSAIAAGIHGLLTPGAAAVHCGPGLAEVCETVGIPPVLHLGSCVDNSRILLAATEVVKAGGLGNDICDLPAAGSAPEWMSEKAISIGQYFVSSGVYTVFGYSLPLEGAPVVKDYLYKTMEDMYGGMWDCEADPVKHAHKMIAHIDKKRKALGIDKARDRVLMDMADRQKLGME
ncbi:anaerobic carbon-monoxide dehydrogenase catalytic subunit [Desulfoprunum benzoelyticum]|uniref:Carbon monoxide dehydrogenase n=1 Tax=Desulfoprunum benzoelyticum TaxID=1506996 RepID=A0A840UQS3_9BACT|nr:anaerobic carbon-monoxide dehydrogenase catalytic subunit [Desulfoprunum benzoelyticum]MBB5347995.1 carbon-monoxide dehydrogenase catalytic subunit [Desulfoprunum benzoelyticum]MBM9530408.1 anaerobic carbon-monoxide dehydrogenase catalytic subunit [Desulfoprunum benzoelyticum]